MHAMTAPISVSALRGQELIVRRASSAGLGFWSFDRATRALTVTDHFRRQFGWPADSAFGYGEFLAVLQACDRSVLERALDGLAHGDGVMELECRIETPAGAVRWLRLAAESASAVGGGAGRLVGICLDITEQKKHEEQTTRLHCAGELAASVGHDLGNLLAIAALCLKRVQGRVPPDHVAHPVATDASHAVLAAGRLARSFLGLAGGRAGHPRTMPIDRSVRSCLDLVRHAAGPAVVVRHEAGAQGALATVQPDQLNLALINLALNARDAMPGGGELVIRTLCIEDRWGLIEVADNGAGMAAEHLARVFEPFFSTKPPGRGTGLGLPQVREMARRCGGEADIRSTPGRGTTVTIRLPLVP